jgi:2-dehydropantoate 2-reductase
MQIYEMSLAKAKMGVAPHKMSLLIDVEQIRPFEVEVIVGAVLRLAKEHGIETPRLELMYSLLKGLQATIVRQRAEKDRAS